MSDKQNNCQGEFPDLEELAERDAMQALGMLSAGLAHEMKTPLGAICCAHGTQRSAHDKLVTRLQELAPEALGDPDIERSLRALKEGDRVVTTGLEKVGGLVTQLQCFLQEKSKEPVAMNLGELLDGALLLVKHELKTGIETRREFRDLPPAFGLPGPTGQILLNLLLNAAQAMAQTGGALTLSAETSDDQIQLNISDNGPGVPPEIKDQVFEFGFTTRKEDGGTGFGLALSRHLARKQGGDLALSETPGGGATFSLSLPLAPAQGTGASP